MKHKPAFDFLNSIDPETADGIARIRNRCPELVDSLLERLYGEAYQRDRLTLRERLLVTVAALMVSAHTEAQLATQARLALKAGLNREELMEVAFQISVLSGLGHAMNGMVVIDAVADQLEIES